ncbi:tetratricopeptide repeat protein [Litorilituus lipolyticus]|uniref:MSHA biogenesis protein MshN n=1 Tax=Litorilituus lipolyticus TaxID=2491017 RepID=A0A502L3L7_9GAMM|nr:tetratricopeptide repeat protein [Litorilituus lipolyticus]TPH17804.1 MSHA biogenesis protein MshN [Litorilituus lipolyticus]
MSVINQMLKDLEERAPEQNQQGVVPAPAVVKSSPIKPIAIIVTVVVIINIVGLYVWHLLQENKALKSQQTIQMANVEPRTNEALKQRSSAEEDSILLAQQKSETKAPADVDKPSKLVKRKAMPEEKKVASKDTVQVKRQNIGTEQVKFNSESVKESNSTKEPAIVEPIKEENKSIANIPTPAQQVQQKKQTASMSVSRRQLTADELVSQKLQQADEMLATRNVAKAEQLLEDVLIIQPEHIEARKKLAALWYGRKAYNKASNLLSQGVALAPNDSELRQMKAQIYVKQNKFRLAYNILEPLANVKEEEYQVLLASVAQETAHFTMAIQSYQQLIDMQPAVGRWYLGQAIVYDKNSQFDLAGKAYRLALAKGDLTNASAQFAQQRLIALGQ